MTHPETSGHEARSTSNLSNPTTLKTVQHINTKYVIDMNEHSSRSRSDTPKDPSRSTPRHRNREKSQDRASSRVAHSRDDMKKRRSKSSSSMPEERSGKSSRSRRSHGRSTSETPYTTSHGHSRSTRNMLTSRKMITESTSQPQYSRSQSPSNIKGTSAYESTNMEKLSGTRSYRSVSQPDRRDSKSTEGKASKAGRAIADEISGETPTRSGRSSRNKN